MVISVKKGTILRNDHVSDNSPLRFSVFTGAAGNYMNVIYVYNGKVKKARFYKHDVGEKQGIVPVRESNILQVLAGVLEDELNKEKRLEQ